MKPWWRKRETPQPVERRMVPDIRTEVHETTSIVARIDHGFLSFEKTFAETMRQVDLGGLGPHDRYSFIEKISGYDLLDQFLQDWQANGYRMEGNKVIPWSAFTGAEIIREEKITQEFQVQYGMKEEA